MKLYIDGSSRGNPGKGLALLYINGKVYTQEHENITNNQAEYYALLMAFEYLHNFHVMNAEILTDSQLIVGHLTKGWKVNYNHELVAKAKKEYQRFSPQLTWISREKNLAGIEIEKRIK